MYFKTSSLITIVIRHTQKMYGFNLHTNIDNTQ